MVDNTLLVDRFVLVDAGERMELIRPREARYQRSRNKSLPAGRTDTLDQNDLEGKPFFEPTVALTMIDRIGEGGFCVMTLPTANGSSRWQFFVNRKRSDSIESFNIARSESGWFDFQGARYYTSPDDVYRASVLERRPGLCPFTKRPLVPVVLDETVEPVEPRWVLKVEPNAANVFAAEPEGGLRIMPPEFEGNHALSIEFWVKAARERTLASAADAGGDASSNTKTLRAGIWHHVQAHCFLSPSGERTKKEVVIDIDESGADLVYRVATLDTPPKPSAILMEVLALVGADILITDLRVFYAPRTTQAVINDRSYQLRGDEYGLAAYFPLSGGTGIMIYDFASGGSAVPGDQSVSWVLDDPPIRENPGVNRRLLVELGGITLGGMSCQFYHEQMAESPDSRNVVRDDARVMLAVTRVSADPGNVFVLDWNATRAGRLARTRPVNVSTLPTLSEPAVGVSEDALSVLRDRREELKKEIRELNDEIAATPPGPVGEAFNQLSATYQNLLSQISNSNGLPPGALNLGGWNGSILGIGGGDGQGGDLDRSMPLDDEPAASLSRTLEIGRAAGNEANVNPALVELRRTLALRQSELEEIERRIRNLNRPEVFPGERAHPYRVAMPTLGTDGLGCTLRGAWLPFVHTWTPMRATLFEAATGVVSLYFAQRSEPRPPALACASFDVKAARYRIVHSYVTAGGGQGTLILLSRISDAAAAETVTRIVGERESGETVAVGIRNETLGIRETWTGVPNDAVQIAMIVNGEIPLPEGCEKKVYLYDSAFKESPAAGPSRLLFARTQGGAGKFREFADPTFVAGSAPAWASEPAGFSFAPRKTFVASLGAGVPLSRMRGDRAVTLESWVLPIYDDLSGKPAAGDYERVVWMKDDPDERSTQVLNYGLALSGSAPIGDGQVVPANAHAILPGGCVMVELNDESVFFWGTPTTVEAWFRFDQSPVDGPVVFGGSLFRLDVVSSVLTASPGNHRIGEIRERHWHHLAIIMDQGGARLFFDGVEQDAAIELEGAPPVVIFAGPKEGRMLLSELRIWSEARSAAQLRTLMNLSLNGQASAMPGLAGYAAPATPGGQEILGFIYGIEGFVVPPKLHRVPNGATNRAVSISAGKVEPAPGPFRTVRCVFDDVALQSVIGIRTQTWGHVAAGYAHSFGLQLKPQLRIEGDSADSLLAEDVTIEMALEWNGSPGTLLAQRIEGDGGHYAFHFSIDAAGYLNFEWQGISISSFRGGQARR